MNSAVRAQEVESIKLQPATIEQKINPGESFSSKIRITNLSSRSETYNIFVDDIDGIAGNGQPIFSDNHTQTGYELSTWVKLSKNSITLPSGAALDVLFTVVAPKDANPGSHFGAIFASVEPGAANENGATVGYRVGTIISLHVSGEVTETADIRSFSSGKRLYGKPEASFEIVVENSGNTIVRPRGPLTIEDGGGKNVGTVMINNDAAAVLPNTKRTFSVSWNDEAFRFGKYTAVASLGYGLDAQRTISASLSFWVLPMNVLGPLVGGLALFSLLLVVGVRMYIRKKMREAGVTSAPRAKGAFGPLLFAGIIVFSILLIVAYFILAA
jgi:hypothetical protein